MNFHFLLLLLLLWSVIPLIGLNVGTELMTQFRLDILNCDFALPRKLSAANFQLSFSWYDDSYQPRNFRLLSIKLVFVVCFEHNFQLNELDLWFLWYCCSMVSHHNNRLNWLLQSIVYRLVCLIVFFSSATWIHSHWRNSDIDRQRRREYRKKNYLMTASARETTKNKQLNFCIVYSQQQQQHVKSVERYKRIKKTKL